MSQGKPGHRSRKSPPRVGCDLPAMTGADFLLAALAVGVAILLARDSHPIGRLLMVVSALAVSALLFLPTGLLGDWFGAHRVDLLSKATRATPLDVSGWVHLFAFAWLGFLLWLARRDIRNWRGVALVIALAVAAELSQWLADGRQPKVEDAALNVLGGLAGVLIAFLCRRIATKVGRRG